jgi:hypothetical protein
MNDNTAPSQHAIQSWQEALFSVSDIDRWINFWAAVGDWEVLQRGALDARWSGGWGLAAGARGETALIGQPGSSGGYIRLVSIDGATQQMRSSGKVWDTGGWFDINVRVKDISTTQRLVQAQGWSALADPVEMNMGTVRVIEWLASGPDGIVVAFIERVAPALTGFPEFDRVSRSFNATQIVADEGYCRSWYEDVLGFKVFIDTPGPGAEGGPNVFGLPCNLIKDIPSHLLLLHPEGLAIGSMEMCSFTNLEGRDFAATCKLPNFGVASLRYPVKDIEGLIAHLRRFDDRVIWISTPAVRSFEPFGDKLCFTIAGPNGEWLEFYQA